MNKEHWTELIHFIPASVLVASFITGLISGCQTSPVAPTPHPSTTPRPVPSLTPPASTVIANPISPQVTAQDGMVQVHVPAGEFLMGSTSADIDKFMQECPSCQRDWFKDQMPQHNVYLDAFWIDQTEVTNAMFAKFVAATGHKTDAEKAGSGIIFNLLSEDWKSAKGADWRHPHGPTTDISGLDNHPVVQMSWNDAHAYCQWAARRLPTEAEWEKAARGMDGRMYPWGNRAPAGNLLNFADRNLNVKEGDNSGDDGYSFTAPVGSYPDGASPYGVLDMAGNVGERVADWYSDAYYTSSPARDPTGPSSGDHHVIRGGSWSRAGWHVSTAARVAFTPEKRSSGVGFRCAASVSTSTPALMPTPSTTAPTSAPTYSLEETYMQDFAIKDFGAVHSPLDGDANEHLIFGAIPVPAPAQNLIPELTAFLGRWEGYSYAPPVKKDWKFVLVVQEITPEGGKALLWTGTNLQYPSGVTEIRFRVVPGATPSIAWQYAGGTNVCTLAYDRGAGLLRGWVKSSLSDSAWGPIELNRNRSFYVYKDYARYLAGKRIYPKEYRDSVLSQFYGKGYLLYLPESYEADTNKTWPLIIFLHGSGDRGDNLFLLAKASPFMFIREKGPLPFIIVAPLLSTSPNYALFPEGYMDGVLAETLADYRVDQKRIYVTGLSLGGEATYRFALHRPNTFAAIAPLSAFFNQAEASTMTSIKDLPVWAIHGADDAVISLAVGQRPMEALKQAGGNVRLTILENHDHDVWTDTYSDPAFYDWLLEHEKP